MVGTRRQHRRLMFWATGSDSDDQIEGLRGWPNSPVQPDALLRALPLQHPRIALDLEGDPTLSPMLSNRDQKRDTARHIPGFDFPFPRVLIHQLGSTVVDHGIQPIEGLLPLEVFSDRQLK